MKSNPDTLILSNLALTLRKEYSIVIRLQDPDIRSVLQDLEKELDDPIISALWNGLSDDFKTGVPKPKRKKPEYDSPQEYRDRGQYYHDEDDTRKKKLRKSESLAVMKAKTIKAAKNNPSGKQPKVAAQQLEKKVKASLDYPGKVIFRGEVISP